MMVAAFDRWTAYLGMAAALVLLARLWWLGGQRKYGLMFSYFLVDLLESVGVWGAPVYSMRYGYVYFAGQAAKTLLAVGVVVQLWLLALREYRGLARFGRQVAVYMLLGALLIAAAGLWLEPPLSPGQSGFAHYFNTIEGALDSMAVLFLVCSTLFLLWFPIVVARNLAMLIGGLVLYLATQWAVLLTVNFYPQNSPEVSLVSETFDLACIIFWILTLTRQGETATTVTGHRWNQEEAERLLGQLQAINTRLDQVTR